jgi:hypothetical protein
MGTSNSEHRFQAGQKNVIIPGPPLSIYGKKKPSVSHSFYVNESFPIGCTDDCVVVHGGKKTALQPQ